jgi:hypothetical protein
MKVDMDGWACVIQIWVASMWNLRNSYNLMAHKLKKEMGG